MTFDPNERQTLITHLRTWDRRLRLTQSVRWMPRGLLAGLAIALMVAMAARFRPLLTQNELLRVSVVLAGVGLVLTLIAVWATGHNLLAKARRFDLLFGLRERISTALELTEGRIPVESETLATHQMEDALITAAGVRAADFLPIRTDWREWGGAALLSVGLAAAILVPNPQEDILQEQAQVEEAIAEEIEELTELKERIESDETLTAEEIAELSELLENTIEELEQPGISQEEAVAALDAAEQELRDLSSEFAEQRQEALEQAGQQLEGTAAENVTEALEQGNPLEAAQELGNLDLDSLTPEELEQLAEALEGAASELAESNPELAEQLAEAAEAIQNGDLEAAENALDEAAGQLAESGGGSVAQVDELADEVDKAEGDVAGSGQGGNQPGQSGMGQAGQQGQEGQGQGSSGSGAGRGEDQGAVAGGPEGDQQDTNNGPGDGGFAEYEGIYSPQRIGGEGGEDVDVPGDPGAGAPTGVEGDFADNPEGDSVVGYDEVFADYEGAANEALENGYIPLGMRDLIRQYFSSLNPDN